MNIEIMDIFIGAIIGATIGVLGFGLLLSARAAQESREERMRWERMKKELDEFEKNYHGDKNC